MTGYEHLCNKLKEKYTISKINSNKDFIYDIVSILAVNENDRTAMELADMKMEEAKIRMREAREAVQIVENFEIEYANRCSQNENKQKELNETQQAIEQSLEYLKQLQSDLNTCETAFGRDRLKLAQMFVNTVNNKSDYDNYAFINGLASILSSGECASTEVLKKVKVESEDI